MNQKRGAYCSYVSDRKIYFLRNTKKGGNLRINLSLNSFAYGEEKLRRNSFRCGKKVHSFQLDLTPPGNLTWVMEC
jgi:hypothetical protein